MPLEWFFHPATQCALIAAGLGLCLYLFATLKRDVSALNRQLRKDRQEFRAAVQRLEAVIAELRSGLEEAQESAGSPGLPIPPRSSLNLSTRSQALRLFRRGEGIAQIAAALEVPENEVELLLKVHHIVLEQA